MFKRKVFAALLLGGSMSLPVLAQGEENFRSDATVQAFGSFVKSNTADDGSRHSATNSGGVLASYRYFFGRHHGVEVNYGYSLNTQQYTLGGGISGVQAYSHETTAAYVLRFPMQKRFTPFVLAGAGAVVFDPKNNVFDNQARATFVYGGGADVNLTNRIFFRAQYRGLVYNSPTFDAIGTERITHRAVPSAGFGFRF